MSNNSSLPLSLIFPVTVVVSPIGSPGLTFNQALIVGSSTAIPSVGSNSRLRLYTSLTAMLTDGFLNSSPEYLAASIYFGQTPQPTYLWIGRQDLTAIQTVIPQTANLGTGYVLGDIITVTQAGAQAGTAKVVSLGAAGAVALETTTGTASSGSTSLVVASATGIQVGQVVLGVGIAPGSIATAVVSTTITLSLPTTAALSTTAVTFSGLLLQTGGTGYSVAASLSTTGGTGTALEADITAVGETPLQSVQACRAFTPAWYCCQFVGTAADADHEAIAGFIEAAAPASTYFYETAEAGVPTGLTSTLPGVLQASAYRRSNGTYSTTQGGSAPNNTYAAAGPMGQAMGLNSGGPNSYFSLSYKTIEGVVFEPLTQTQVSAICGAADGSSTGLNCNAVVNFQNGAYPSLFIFGRQASGVFFDEVLQIDMLVNDMQTSGMNFFISQPSIPITDAGVGYMKNLLAGACQRSQSRGFIAPSGTWKGITVGTGANSIENGDPLPNGYYLYAPPVSTLSQGQLGARQLPPITVLVIEAGSGLSLAINVQVQR